MGQPWTRCNERARRRHPQKLVLSQSRFGPGSVIALERVFMEVRDLDEVSVIDLVVVVLAHLRARGMGRRFQASREIRPCVVHVDAKPIDRDSFFMAT